MITFDAEKQEYVLNFGQDREFNKHNGKRITPLIVLEERVSELTGEVERLAQEGDLLGARKILEADLLNAKRDYQTASSAYSEAKGVYESAVAKMNVELKSLRERK